MHKALLRQVILVCQQREREGDRPTVPALSVETLEDAVVELAKYLPSIELKFSNNWLRNKISSDPEADEPQAGRELP